MKHHNVLEKYQQKKQNKTYSKVKSLRQYKTFTEVIPSDDGKESFSGEVVGQEENTELLSNFDELLSDCGDVIDTDDDEYENIDEENGEDDFDADNIGNHIRVTNEISNNSGDRIRNIGNSFASQYSEIIRDRLWKFVQHLESVVGGRKTVNNINTILKRVGYFLYWYDTTYPLNMDLDVESKLLDMMNNKALGICAYTAHLDSLGARPTTVKCYMEAINCIKRWMVISNKGITNGDAFGAIVTDINKQYKKAAIIRNHDKSDINELIRDGKWPANGLEELQKSIYDQDEWIKEMVCNINI
jgi:hypothetical protein